MSRAVGIPFAIVGFVCLSIGVKFGIDKARWHSESGTTVGEVVSNRAGESCSGSGTKRRCSTIYYPTVAFTASGRNVSFESGVGTSDAYAVGDTVPVRFAKEDAHDAEIDSILRIFGVSIFLTLFGLVFGGVGLAVSFGEQIGYWLRSRSIYEGDRPRSAA